MQLRGKAMHSQLQSPLFRLPCELRVEIYIVLFRATKLTVRNYDAGTADLAGLGLAILQTCRCIYEEASLFWPENVLFDFQENHLPDIFPFFKGSREIRTRVRRALVCGINLLAPRDPRYNGQPDFRLQIAVQHSLVFIARSLIKEHRVQLDDPDASRRTPLWYAAKGG